MHHAPRLNSYGSRWRAALHLTAAVVVVLVALGLRAAPAAHAGVATAQLSVTSTWQTGFIARFVITNPTTAPLADWKLEFDLPAGESILHSWNSAVTNYGTHYVLTPPANWNRIIAPGGTATGGFPRCAEWDLLTTRELRPDWTVLLRLSAW